MIDKECYVIVVLCLYANIHHFSEINNIDTL